MQPSRDLPLYLRGNFSLFHGNVAGRAVTWAQIEEQTAVTPDRLLEQSRQLERFFQTPVVFVFQELDSWQRKRLLEKQVAFVQTNKQLYIPQLLLQLNDIRTSFRKSPNRSQHVSFSTQVAILFHLQRERLDNQSAFEIAIKLGYSPMTVTRIIRELQQWEWVDVHPGKERTFQFREQGEKLWDLTHPWLRNPHRDTWFTDDPLSVPNYILSGETALSEYTMLGERRVTYLAITKDQIKLLRASQRLQELNTHEGRYCLQVWQYEPRLLVEPGQPIMDRLSLYLSLKEEPDERVQDALQKMIKGVIW